MTTPDSSSSRYQARGVSASKSEVHAAVDQIDKGLYPLAFCKVTEDHLGGDPMMCNVIHSDGSGSKSIIAYLHYRETGDASVFEGIAQDSIVMNVDDLLCVGVVKGILMSSTINRHSKHCPGEVLDALIGGSERFMQLLRDNGIEIVSGGGETADVGDLTETIVVDSCAVARLPRRELIAAGIGPDLAIVGLSSSGKASYEKVENSGIGSNGLTSARHDLLNTEYALKYPESFDPGISKDLVYCGPYKLKDELPESNLSVGDALLSPTRSYAPIIVRLLKNYPGIVKAMVHCSGGGQTKCRRFGKGIRFVKDNLMEPPAIFKTIQKVSGTTPKEMYEVYNMGHRMEVYCPEKNVDDIVAVAKSFNIEAQQIGHTEKNDEGDEVNRVIVKTPEHELKYE